MRKHTTVLGWSAIFILVAVLFVPSLLSHKADAALAVPARCAPAPEFVE